MQLVAGVFDRYLGHAPVCFHSKTVLLNFARDKLASSHLLFLFEKTRFVFFDVLSIIIYIEII